MCHIISKMACLPEGGHHSIPCRAFGSLCLGPLSMQTVISHLVWLHFRGDWMNGCQCFDWKGLNCHFSLRFLLIFWRLERGWVGGRGRLTKTNWKKEKEKKIHNHQQQQKKKKKWCKKSAFSEVNSLVKTWQPATQHIVELLKTKESDSETVHTNMWNCYCNHTTVWMVTAVI